MTDTKITPIHFCKRAMDICAFATEQGKCELTGCFRDSVRLGKKEKRMTRQEAARIITVILDCCKGKEEKYEEQEKIPLEKSFEALSMAIEVLRQEPSKEYDYSKSVWENIQEGNGISKEIPKEPKRGKWKNIRGNNIGDCSECECRGRVWMNYCWNCGAKMEFGE